MEATTAGEKHNEEEVVFVRNRDGAMVRLQMPGEGVAVKVYRVSVAFKFGQVQYVDALHDRGDVSFVQILETLV